jgi:hypothetical protein
MLVELLQPLGPELVRRWVATLLMVPRDQREGVVAAVEQRIAEMYEQSWRAGEAAAEQALAPQNDPSHEVDVVHPPTQREIYVEQVVTTYERVAEPAIKQPRATKSRRKKQA